MKLFICVTVTALLFAATSFLAGSLLTGWYADNFAKSDADISFGVAVFLGCWPVAWIAGGFVGHKLYATHFRSTRRL